MPKAARCAFRDCDRFAADRLWFGQPTPLPLDYCAEHADVVREIFVVARETQLAMSDIVEPLSPSASATHNGRKTHCLRGHRFTLENTYVTRDGRRRCRACGRDHDRRRNGYRGLAPPALRDRCPKGHAYDAANTHVYRGRDGRLMRRCRACDRERKRRRSSEGDVRPLAAPA